MTRQGRAIHQLGRYARPGTAPGLLRLEEEAPPPSITITRYSAEAIEEEVVGDLAGFEDQIGAWPVVWIDVIGFGRGPELVRLQDGLDLHSLAMEDVVHLGQRAKVEAYDHHLFVIGRMAHTEQDLTEQVSLFVGEGWVLTIQERIGDSFEGVRVRLREGKGRIRSRGADYLAYALLDTIVDSYFPVLDQIGDRLETLESDVFADPDPGTTQRIHGTRRRLLALRKSILPHRDAIHSLLRDEHPLIARETSIFLRDVYDHVLRITDFIETYRELTGDLLSVYLTVVSNRMNEIMKVLTVIATIFIPLGFIAGVYGMNFDPSASRWNMPELGWPFGYPFALGLMAVVGGGLLYWMWRRGWL